MKTIKILLLLVMTMLVMTVDAQKGTVLSLWPNGAPNTSGVATDTAKVTVFLPTAKKATGRAVVICPGGGYGFLAMEHEGTDWVSFFNKQGIAVFILKYRMPYGNYEIPVSDVEECMRFVRRNAKQWHIDPKQVGIMGFSAGGHLASTLATHATDTAAPNFQILFYPVITMKPDHTHRGSHDNFLGTKRSKKQMKRLEQQFSNDLQVTRATPRAFIVLSDDDEVVLPTNGVSYYLECLKRDVSATLHVYPTGGHGWGYRDSFEFHDEMVLELKTWLQSF
jgi:acetyl esterase/lipase